MGHYLEGNGLEVDGLKFSLWMPGNYEPPQLSWSELADLTHSKQVELFGFCTCEDGPKVWDDCTQDGT
jgi:hypothetical protein